MDSLKMGNNRGSENVCRTILDDIKESINNKNSFKYIVSVEINESRVKEDSQDSADELELYEIIESVCCACSMQKIKGWVEYSESHFNFYSNHLNIDRLVRMLEERKVKKYIEKIGIEFMYEPD